MGDTNTTVASHWPGLLGPQCGYHIKGAQCPGRLLGMVGENPSVSKLNRLHVVISLNFPLNGFKVHSIDSY